MLWLDLLHIRCTFASEDQSFHQYLRSLLCMHLVFHWNVDKSTVGSNRGSLNSLFRSSRSQSCENGVMFSIGGLETDYNLCPLTLIDLAISSYLPFVRQSSLVPIRLSLSSDFFHRSWGLKDLLPSQNSKKWEKTCRYGFSSNRRECYWFEERRRLKGSYRRSCSYRPFLLSIEMDVLQKIMPLNYYVSNIQYTIHYK